MDFPSTQVLDDNDDSSSSRSSETLHKTPKRVYQVATLTVGNKKYPIFEGINKVGRHSDNDICINDNNVSMFHAEIEADAKHAFICDLRSTNKTRMNDEKLKPDRFYQLLDGAKLTFGILNGIYLRLRDDESIIIPSTPEPGLKLRKDSNTNLSKPNISSTGDSDDSIILGSQEVSEVVFAKPSIPNRTENIKNTNNDTKTIHELDKSIHDQETQHTNKSIESQICIHECATQKYNSKKSDEKKLNANNKQMSKRKNIDKEESDIFDKETQKISTDREKYDMENAMTQKIVDAKIYDIETQKLKELESQDTNNMYSMATQRFQPLNINIRKEKTEIYDIETQHSTDKSNKFQNQNALATVQNTPSQKVNMVVENGRKHEKDKTYDIKNDRISRSRKNDEEIMATDEKVRINNSSTNNKFHNVSQKQLDSTTNKMAAETTQNLMSTLMSDQSCLIVAETDDESETDDEGVFSTFFQKNSNTIRKMNNTDSEVTHDSNCEDVNNKDDSSYRNCASPVLVNSYKILESFGVKHVDNIADDCDNKTYMTPIQSPIKPNSHNEEIATQRIASPTQAQKDEKNKNVFKATQSMIATQVLVETQKIDSVVGETNLLETQIIDTQVHEIKDCTFSKKNQAKNDTFHNKRRFDDDNDEGKEQNLNKNHNDEPTQLIELEKNIMTKNTLKEQETAGENGVNNNDNINEHPLKTLRLKKKKTSQDFEEWRISSSCRSDSNVDHFDSEFQEASETGSDDDKNINNINDQDKHLSPKRTRNKDKKLILENPVADIKINLSLNRNEKIEFKNKKGRNQEIHTSNSEDNDIVAKNLDNMFEKAAGEDMIEPTHLLTQQLVDILESPEKSDNVDTVIDNFIEFQKFPMEKKKEKLGNCSSVDEESQELYFANLNSKRKRKAIFDSQDSSNSGPNSKYRKNFTGLNSDEPCLSGFLNGVAIVSKKFDEQENINYEEANDENDILLGLPEVNLNGTGVSPSSHNSSEDSSDEDTQSNKNKLPVLEQSPIALKSKENQKSVLSLQCDNNSDKTSVVNKSKTQTHTGKEKILSKSQIVKSKLISKVVTSQHNSTFESEEETVPKKRTNCDISQSLIEYKKERSVVKLDDTLNISMRQELKRKSAQVQKYYVIFTGINAENYIEPVKQLGGIVTDEPSKATILVTDRVRRTYKFICAISRSIPIVSKKWIDECIENDTFLNPDRYILKDEASEIKFDFELGESLKKSREHLLLQGYTFIITSKVVNPSIKDLKDMIQVAGGKSLVRMPRVWVPNTVIIGCDADIPKIKEMVKKIPKNITVPIVTTEFILAGILKQILDSEQHKLY